MKQVVLIGAICAAVSACNTAQGPSPVVNVTDLKAQAQAAEAAFLQAERDCQAMNFKNRVEHAACLNEAESRLKGPLMFSDRDLLDKKIATRTALAKRIDKRQITEAQADIRLNKAVAQLEAEIAERANARRAVKVQ